MNKDEIFHNDKKPLDIKTDYGKGFVPEIDPRTDYGKGIVYKSIDGNECSTMEEVEEANKLFYDSLITEEEQPKRHR